MKTTLNISDTVMEQLKREAAKQGRTMSDLVESALRALFQRQKKPKIKLPPLPEWDSGGARVNVANRESLYDAMSS